MPAYVTEVLKYSLKYVLLHFRIHAAVREALQRLEMYVWFARGYCAVVGDGGRVWSDIVTSDWYQLYNRETCGLCGTTSIAG